MNWIRTLLAALMSIAGWSAQATDVGGPINTQTVWSSANSPYVVTADISVNALLIIEPGVTVYMSPETGIRVAHTLIAQGTAEAPITITSIRARPDSGSSPQPGDWDVLELVESVALPSRIEHVAIRYGRGVVLQRISPVMSNVAFEHHLGAAMRMSLDAQPVGGDLSASGNLINGIVVPAGTVQSGAWNLTGIPYVVESGLVRVGQVAVQLRLPGSRVQRGESINLTLELAEPAPPGGMEAVLSSDVAGIFGFASSGVIAAGQTELVIPVQGLELGVGTITASVAGRGSDSVYLQVADLPVLTINPGNVSVPVGRSRTMGVSLSVAAPSTGLLVQLTAADSQLLSVPASVSVPPGVIGASFEVTGLAAGSTSVHAQAIGYQSASRQVQVRPLSLSWPTTVLIPPGTSNVRLTLSDPAPAGGLSIGLSSNAPQILVLPAAVSVPAGATEVQVPMTGIVEGLAEVVASATGYGSAQTQVTVEIINLSFDLSSYTVPLGLDEPFTVRASKPAPAGGLVVQLSSSAPEIAAVSPSSVTIPAGQTSAPVRADILGVALGDAAITVQGEGLTTGQLAITVGAAASLAFGTATLDVGLGLRTVGSPQLHMERDGVWITSRRVRTFILDSAAPSSMGVPVSVSLPAGAVTTAVPIEGLAITPQTVVLSASASQFQSAQLAVSVVQPTLMFSGLPGLRPLIDGRHAFWLSWRVPGTPEGSQVAAQLQLIDVSVVQANPAGIVTGIYGSNSGGAPLVQMLMPAGSSNSQGAFVGAPSAIGSYRLQAQASAGIYQSELQTVNDFALRFSLASEVIGRGLQTSAVRVLRERDGSPHAPSSPLLISLQSSDASRAHVPITVTIPANQSGVDVLITGIANASNVQISATTASTYRAAAPLTLAVVEPRILLERLDGSRVVGGLRDEFGVSWDVPGATHPNQASVAGTTVELSIVEADPVDVVPGLSDGSAPISSVLIAQGWRSVSAYVDSPTALGHYKVAANIASVSGGPWLSATQQVAENALQFTSTTVATSVGLAAPVHLELQGSTVGSVTASLLATPEGVVALPATAELEAGGLALRIKLIGESPGSALVVASSSSAGIAPASLSIEVVPIQFEFAQRGPGTFFGYFSSPGGVVQSTEAVFEIIDANPVGLATITENAIRPMYEGSNSTNYGEYPQDFTRLEFSASGSFRIRANIAGVGVFDSPIYLAEGPPPLELDIYDDVYVIGTGLYGSSIGFLQVRQNGVTVQPPEPFSVQFSCLDPLVCIPDSPVVMSSNGYFAIAGGVVGSSILEASAEGFASDSALIQVVPVELEFYFDTQEPFTVGSVRELGFSIGPNGTPLQDMDFTVVSTNAGQVSGIPPVVQIVAGEYGNFIDLEALAPGTFTVSFSAPGVGTFTSPPITVEAP